MKLYFLDKLGWPVERIKGRPITNAIRLMLHTRRITTKRPKCLDPQPVEDEWEVFSSSAGCIMRNKSTGEVAVSRSVL